MIMVVVMYWEKLMLFIHSTLIYCICILKSFSVNLWQRYNVSSNVTYNLNSIIDVVFFIIVI